MTFISAVVDYYCVSQKEMSNSSAEHGADSLEEALGTSWEGLTTLSMVTAPCFVLERNILFVLQQLGGKSLVMRRILIIIIFFFLLLFVFFRPFLKIWHLQHAELMPIGILGQNNEIWFYFASQNKNCAIFWHHFSHFCATIVQALCILMQA